jgi:hypothetical protein
VAAGALRARVIQQTLTDVLSDRTGTVQADGVDLLDLEPLTRRKRVQPSTIFLRDLAAVLAMVLMFFVGRHLFYVVGFWFMRRLTKRRQQRQGVMAMTARR